jgi:hypothetical protein
VTNAGPPSRPSSFGFGAGSQAVSNSSGWATTPTGHGGFPGTEHYYGVALQSFPPRRSANGLVVAAVIAAVAIACVSFLAGRFTAPKTTLPVGEAGIPGAAFGTTSVPTSAVVPSPALTVTDPAGDAVPHAVDGNVYGPSDITSLSVRSDGSDLVITTTYTPSTPMNLVSAETSIRLDADTVPNCKNTVLDSADWAIDYDAAAGGISVLKPGANCGDRFESTSISGAAEVTGYTVTVKISEASLGIRPGQRIVVRTCASTRIDSGHTTFIQDWAPDSPSGITGSI